VIDCIQDFRHMFSIVANMLTSLPLKLVQITCPLETALSQTLRFGYNCCSFPASAPMLHNTASIQFFSMYCKPRSQGRINASCLDSRKEDSVHSLVRPAHVAFHLPLQPDAHQRAFVHQTPQQILFEARVGHIPFDS